MKYVLQILAGYGIDLEKPFIVYDGADVVRKDYGGDILLFINDSLEKGKRIFSANVTISPISKEDELEMMKCDTAKLCHSL